MLENQIYDCRGPYVVAGQKFENYDPNFADMSVTEAIAKSANVCMSKVAQDIGSARFREGLSRFGFDTKSSGMVRNIYFFLAAKATAVAIYRRFRLRGLSPKGSCSQLA